VRARARGRERERESEGERGRKRHGRRTWTEDVRMRKTRRSGKHWRPNEILDRPSAVTLGIVASLVKPSREHTREVRSSFLIRFPSPSLSLSLSLSFTLAVLRFLPFFLPPFRSFSAGSSLTALGFTTCARWGQVPRV
jgi:hypothetical protein